MSRGNKDYAILAVLFSLTLLVYANSLRNPFVIDDQHIIVRNFLLRQWTLPHIFKSHLFAPLGEETQYYRPLTLLTFALNYAVSELNPLGYHVVNLAFHLLVVILSYLFLSRLVPHWIAGFSAALFAVHPADVQAVSYISSRSDPLYTVMTLLTLIFWLKGTETVGPQKAFFRSLSMVSFFLGLLAKETAIAAPALIILTDWIWTGDEKWKQKLARNWPWYVSFGIVLAIYIMIRVGFAGYALNMEGSKEVWQVGRELGMWQRLLLALQLLHSYLSLALYPINLSFFRGVRIPQSPFEWDVLLGAVSLGVLLTLACSFWCHRKEIPYGILWFFISISPVLNLTSLNAPMMEHWLYLPLIGVALAFVGCLHAIFQRMGEVRGGAFGLVLLVMLLSAKTVSRNAEWREPITLFRNDARRYPNEQKNWFLLGYAYLEKGMAAPSIRAYQSGLAINPNHSHGWSGLGEALSMAGRDEEAERSFVRAVSIKPENAWLHYVLGIHRLKAGKVNTAIDALSRAVSLNPPLPIAYHVLGSAYLRRGEKDEAEKAFRQAVSMLPEVREIHASVHFELGKLYMERGDRKSAEEEWRLALRFDQNHMEARMLLEKQTKP